MKNNNGGDIYSKWLFGANSKESRNNKSALDIKQSLTLDTSIAGCRKRRFDEN